MTHELKMTAAAAGELEDWGPLEPPLAEALGDPMPTRGVETWASPDEKVSTGIWECEPGPSRWHFSGNGEFIHVISGRMTCTDEAGDAVTLTAGDSMTFPPGWKGEWRIEETLRKVYTVFPAA